jgi:hypothetical protein
MAISGMSLMAGVALLTAGCAVMPWIERQNADSPAMVIAHECEAQTTGTRVTGIDTYGRPVFVYKWENDRGFFEQCYRDKRQAMLKARPELSPDTLPLPTGQTERPK